MVRRIYVEKKPGLRQEAQSLLRELRTVVGVSALEDLRLLNRYDVEGLDEAAFLRAVGTVFSEPQVDAATAERRVELVVELQSRVMDAFNGERLGECLEVLCEGFDGQAGCFVGRTYADSPDIDGRVLFSAARSVSPGEFVMVRITGAEDGDLVGEMEENA